MSMVLYYGASPQPGVEMQELTPQDLNDFLPEKCFIGTTFGVLLLPRAQATSCAFLYLSVCPNYSLCLGLSAFPAPLARPSPN